MSASTATLRDTASPGGTRPGRGAAATAGVVSAGLALGVGELVAGFDGRFTSPVESVATQTIDSVPLSVERFAIETFGKNDKLVLVIGVVVVSAIVGAVLGVVARRRPRAGTLGLAGFALVGVAAALARPNADAVVALPSLAAGLAGIVSLRLLVPRERAPAVETDPRSGIAGIVAVTRGGVADRRSFLTVTGAAAAGAVLAAAGGRRLRSRFSAAESRARVRLPAAARPLPPVPEAVEVGVDGVAPFVTPNRDFYRVDTALVTPQVRAEDWTLRVTGMVDRPFELTFAELLDRDLVEADITMTCVSNLVGGDLVGTAPGSGCRPATSSTRPASGAAPTSSSAARPTATPAGSPSRPPTTATVSSRSA